MNKKVYENYVSQKINNNEFKLTDNGSDLEVDFDIFQIEWSAGNYLYLDKKYNLLSDPNGWICTYLTADQMSKFTNKIDTNVSTIYQIDFKKIFKAHSQQKEQQILFHSLEIDPIFYKFHF